MKKFFTLFLIVILACLIGGIYGIFHDQLTYTISPEYYTKFKFIQFGLVDFGIEAILPQPRLAVAYVGFMATWWMGVPIGFILGLTGLLHTTAKEMLIITLKAFGVTLLISFLTALAGLAYGYFILSERPQTTFINWFIPSNLIDFRNFIAVGSMHNFSYLGGVIGLGGGIIYSIQKIQVKPKGILGSLITYSVLLNPKASINFRGTKKKTDSDSNHHHS